jgi:hypothetical protein
MATENYITVLQTIIGMSTTNVILDLNLDQYPFTLDKILSIYMIVSISHQIYVKYIKSIQHPIISYSRYLTNALFKIFPEPVVPTEYTKWNRFIYAVRQLLHWITILVVIAAWIVIISIIVQLYELCLESLYIMFHYGTWDLKRTTYALLTAYNYIEVDKWYQHNKHLFVKGYSDIIPDSVNPESCGICLEPMTEHLSKIDSCTHVYHTECISPWYKQSPRCPVCR